LQGDIVLVSLRDFQKDSKKCDIAHKYFADEAKKLKAYKEIPENTELNTAEQDTDPNFVFGDESGSDDGDDDDDDEPTANRREMPESSDSDEDDDDREERKSRDSIDDVRNFYWEKMANLFFRSKKTNPTPTKRINIF